MKTATKHHGKGLPIRKIIPRQHTDRGASQGAAGV